LHRIVLDAMGGDFAPSVTVKGAILAVKESSVSVILTGPKQMIEDEIKNHTDFPHDKISIVDCPDIVGMAESPTLSFKKKKKSSIYIGLELVKNGEADAFVSAGNTGAVMTTALFVLGRLPGVERPGLAAIFPSSKSDYVIVDVGSSVDCKPNHLRQFAIMGKHFSREILSVDNPRIGLFNLGEEEDKGNQLTLSTYHILKQCGFNFIGNVEGKDLTRGAADVVVCDGFVGNSLLKFGEGISKMLMSFFKLEARSSWLSMVGLLFLKPAFKRFKKRYDYDQYGGANLLGVNGICIIAHGSASHIAIKNAIKVATRGVQSNIVKKIGDGISSSQISDEESVTPLIPS
jgi:glycerol-3-phosphate acyltransferase PlsX